MQRTWWVVIFFCLLQACQPGPREETAVSVASDSISTPPIATSPIAIEADTVYLHYLDSLHKHKLTVESAPDSNHMDLSYHFVPQKFDFTGDGTMDYLILSSFDHRFVMGHIIDGATGKRLNEWERHEGVLDMDSTIPLALNFNRPDHDKIETRVVDVNCEDEQQELLVICDNAFVQMGGPVSYCAMFRYDPQTQSIKSIFEHTIEYHHLDAGPPNSTDEDVVNYLDILYEDKPCIDSIRIWKAYVLADSASSEEVLDYRLIRPGRGASKLYQFNDQDNTFEEVGPKIADQYN